MLLDKKIKICFLAKANSINSYRWIKYFAENDNYEIHWISLAPNIFDEIKNLKFYPLKDYRLKFLNIFLNLGKFKKLIRIIKPDIINAHYAGVNGTLTAFSGFHPFILTAYGSDILIAPKFKIAGILIKYALKRADLITCDAEHMKRAMIDLRAEPSKIKIINFGVDTEKFSPGEKDKELKERLGAANSDIIISLRGLEPIYNIETLVKAVPLTLNEFPSAMFIIGGAGSEEKKLKDLVRSLNVDNNVRFAGWISNDDLPQYLRTSDIYVSTSLSDAGIASSTAEAMACGLASIITDFGDNKEWIKNGENGFLIPVKNPELLAEKIVYLLKNENLRKNFGQKSRKIIEEKNNYYKEMEKMEEIYKELIRK